MVPLLALTLAGERREENPKILSPCVLHCSRKLYVWGGNRPFLTILLLFSNYTGLALIVFATPSRPEWIRTILYPHTLSTRYQREEIQV